MLPRPNLDYPVTRAFPSTFSTAAFLSATVVIIFLVVINVALVGYNTVTQFNSDFNVTQHFWYDIFIPSVAQTTPGTLCDPRLVQLGDTVTTNYTLFQYTVALIDQPNAGDAGLSYRGWTLENCDITTLFFNADGWTFSIDHTALVVCQAPDAQAAGNGSEITLRADWSQSFLQGEYTSLLGVQLVLKDQRAGSITLMIGDPTSPISYRARGAVLDALMQASSTEFTVRRLDLLALTNLTSPRTLSFQASFPWCPASMGREASCAMNVPPPNITGMSQVSGTGKLSAYVATQPPSTTNQQLPSNDTFAIVANTVQAVYAAIRLDLGNDAPNNFLVNTSAIPEAIIRDFPPPAVTNTTSNTTTALPGESFLYSVLVGDGYWESKSPPGTGASGFPEIHMLLPLNMSGPAVLDGVYLCHFQYIKEPGPLIVAVLVATQSTFMLGWGVFMRFATGWAKKRSPDANTCEANSNGTYLLDVESEKPSEHTAFLNNRAKTT
ncbi:hypothetical protein K438DRAFT_2017864 [Mycena galopus ATCC 62051]|nr:hypothetical protein K438DRAFT_2017864 [Mycena galopus ATCC 62051]